MESNAPEAVYAYLSTIGRVTGKTHRIEIWFVRAGMTAYILNDAGRSNWVMNVRANPHVTLEIGNTKFAAQARVARDGEDQLARRLLFEKYTSEKELRTFTEASTTIVVAFDLASQTE